MPPKNEYFFNIKATEQTIINLFNQIAQIRLIKYPTQDDLSYEKELERSLERFRNLLDFLKEP